MEDPTLTAVSPQEQARRAAAQARAQRQLEDAERAAQLERPAFGPDELRELVARLDVETCHFLLMQLARDNPAMLREMFVRHFALSAGYAQYMSQRAV